MSEPYTMLRFVLLALAVTSCLANGPKIKDCHPNGEGKSDVQIKNMDIKPYPFSFPDLIKIKFDVEVKRLVTNFDLSIVITKDLDGVQVRIPCVNGTGSCFYKDACGQLAKAFPDGCPIWFPDCQCPFPKGDRKFKEMEVLLPILPPELAVIATGRFYVTISLLDSTLNENIIACSNLRVDLR